MGKRQKINNGLVRLLQTLRLYSPTRRVRDLTFGSHRREYAHEKDMLDFYSQFIGKDDLCFDVGANVGKFTKIFLELGASVVCVEPQDACLKQLHKMFDDNSNVVIVGKAVGECEGYGELMVCEAAPTISTMSTKWKDEGRFSKDFKWTKKKTVPVITLDALIRSYGLPKFCKIDIEGYEEPALKGLTQPVPIVAFEFTREFFGDARRCVSRIQSIGQAEFNCSIGESMKLLLEKWVTPDKLYEKLDQVGGKLLWGDIYARFA